MNDFKPWRKKVGVATLMLGCVFVAGWVRSEIVRDLVIVQFSNSNPYYFASNRSQLSCDWQIFSSIEPTGRILWRTQTVQPSIQMDGFQKYAGINFRFCGLLLLRNKWGLHWVIPYWAIVMPLTVISAWLLLSKVRHKQTESPTAESS